MSLFKKPVFIIIFLLLALPAFCDDSFLPAQTIIFFENESVKKSFSENKQQSIEVLILAIELLTDNIANYNVTSTLHGGPYKRQYIFIDASLKAVVNKDDQIKTIYDPSHPDAIAIGELEGNVLYPNIERTKEQENLTIILDALKIILQI